MIEPLIEYEQLKKIDRIEAVAYDRLIGTYLELKLKGDKKLIDIESTDQESKIKSHMLGIPVPGMIYIFNHVNDGTLEMLRELKSGKNIQFHDLTPIIFCMSYNLLTKTVKGLNLTMLPAPERVKFLQSFYKLFESFFKDVEQKTQYGKLAINKNYIEISLLGKNSKMIEQFNKINTSLFNYAYRSYKFDNIKNFRMIEFEEWRYIPFYSPNKAFAGTNLNQLYKMYWNNLQEK